jgi:hypothetical protein
MAQYILTGAGFSRNWGGWLASEVFEYLLGCPEVADSTALRSLLWRHQRINGFESALAEVQRDYVRNPNAHLNALRGLQAAIERMFSHMNEHLFTRTWELNQDRERSITRFLARFDAIFTLNQDQLLEHHYNPELENSVGRLAWAGLQLPGAARQEGPGPHGPSSQAGPRWLTHQEGQLRPDPHMQPLYKLHGSSGWADHINPQVMILGDNKARDIGLFPVLSHYFEQFETALAAGDAKLMIIGYGFRDQHINEVLVRSVIEHGMRFFVVDPLGADIARAVNPTANAPIQGPPSDLEEAFVQGCRGASRRGLRDIFGPDAVEFHKVMRFFED